MSNQEQSLINIQAQIKSLLGVDVKVKFEDEEIDYTFGTAIRFDSSNYSPEITRFYGKEIEEVEEQELINAYAIAFGSIPTKFIPSEGEVTTYTFLPKKEGVFELNPNTWYQQESQRYGVRVEVSGAYELVMVSGASAYFFKPDKDVKVEVSKKLVWGVQHDNDWEFYSSWSEEDDIDPTYSLVEGDNHYYAKQEEVWEVEVLPLGES